MPRWCCDWGGWRRCRTVGCTGQRLLGTLHLGTGTGPLWGRGRTVLLGQEAEGGSSSGHAVGGRGWVWVRPAHRKLQTPVVATLLRGPHGLTMINTGIGACLFGENSNNDDRRACIKTLAANYPVCSHHVRCGTAVHDCSQTGVRQPLSAREAAASVAQPASGGQFGTFAGALLVLLLLLRPFCKMGVRAGIVGRVNLAEADVAPGGEEAEAAPGGGDRILMWVRTACCRLVARVGE